MKAHQITTYELPPGSNFELVCSCGERSGVLVGRKADVRAIVADHEETGAAFPEGGITIVTLPKGVDGSIKWNAEQLERGRA